MGQSKGNLPILIVGKGLAGTHLALACCRKEISFHIVEDAKEVAASQIATGLMNPFAGRKFALSWRWKECYSKAKEVYSFYQNKWGAEIFHEYPILRLFSSVKEENIWPDKTLQYPDLLADWNSNEFPNADIIEGSGGLITKEGARLICDEFLKLAEQEFRDSIIHAHFKQVERNSEGNIIFQGKEYQSIVFAGGYRDYSRPEFKGLTLNPCKGTLLDIQLKESDQWNVIPIRGSFVVPRKAGSCRVGSTYTWSMEDGIEKGGREKIQEKLEKLLVSPVEVENEMYGWRPTVKDRRPLLGKLGDQLYCFNGLGSKGSLQAPLLAEEFLDYYQGKLELRPEIDVARFLPTQS